MIEATRNDGDVILISWAASASWHAKGWMLRLLDVQDGKKTGWDREVGRRPRRIMTAYSWLLHDASGFGPRAAGGLLTVSRLSGHPRNRRSWGLPTADYTASFVTFSILK